MKASNLWAPWACALIVIALVIIANTTRFAAQKGEWWFYGFAIFFAILVPVTYNIGKNNKS